MPWVYSISLSNSSSNGWAFNGELSHGVGVVLLGSKHRGSAGAQDGSGGGEQGEACQWIDEITIFTGVGRHDHHATILRLFYSDTLLNTTYVL
jgi:hypothetical protein